MRVAGRAVGRDWRGQLGRRGWASVTSTSPASSGGAPRPPPRAGRSYFSLGLRYLVTPVALFYAGGLVLARFNENVYDFYSEQVPGGERLLEVLDRTTAANKDSRMLRTTGREQGQEQSQVERVLRNVRQGTAETVKSGLEKIRPVAGDASKRGEEVKGRANEVKNQAVQRASETKDQAVQRASGAKDQAVQRASETNLADRVSESKDRLVQKAVALAHDTKSEAKKQEKGSVFGETGREFMTNVQKAQHNAAVKAGQLGHLVQEETRDLRDQGKDKLDEAAHRANDLGHGLETRLSQTMHQAKDAVTDKAHLGSRAVSELDAKQQSSSLVSSAEHAAHNAVGQARGPGLNQGAAAAKASIGQVSSPTKSATSPPVLLDASRPRDVSPLNNADVSLRGKQLAPGVRIGLEMAPPPPPKPLPLVSPTVKQLGIEEPVIAQLAGTIDQFIQFLKDNPASKNAKTVIEHAQSDLKSLADRMEAVKAEEKARLEHVFEKRTREVEQELKAKEEELKGDLKAKESEWRSIFERERGQLTELYRNRLTEELETQNKIINERLREEVINQGIEMQRRWLRDVKIRVEEERGGRLARLNELAGEVKRLERMTLDNDSFLDANVKVHSLWSALRSLQSALERPHKMPFTEELTVLGKMTASDPVSQEALAAVQGPLASEGVESFGDLVDRFGRVSAALKRVSLLPENASVLSHFFSLALSPLLFTRKGLVQGQDVPSILSRVQFHLNEGDLDSATRELNQVQGWAKVLASDWIKEARKHLTVKQAIEVIETQASLETLLVT